MGRMKEMLMDYIELHELEEVIIEGETFFKDEDGKLLSWEDVTGDCMSALHDAAENACGGER